MPCFLDGLAVCPGVVRVENGTRRSGAQKATSSPPKIVGRRSDSTTRGGLIITE
jgi:hypothetical protein